MRRLLVLSAALLLMGARSAIADPLVIDITQTRYTIDLINYIQKPSEGFVSNKTSDQTQADPFSDSLVTTAYGSLARAEGTADLFSTTSHTFAGQLSGEASTSTASVSEHVTFLSATDQSGDVGLTIGIEPNYTKGFVTLDDITTGLVVWTYAWDFLESNLPGTDPSNTVPFTPSCHCFADFLVPTTLLADHLYQLDMFQRSQANKDGQTINMKVSNLIPTPEPSTWALLLLGCGLFFYRHERTRTT